ncbi:type I glutamate--ammonia ligase [Butyrivibrio sp. NC3005]|uniref:type I glutamate--ammonia ligase n=1 Tax=Butyrivibrio sp. NC3005 TaxID=1280685 RepID=UPI0003F93A7E|nr:type I glutamate--ammonia ligase [Butyrivibrio sp. NC3005]
MSKYTREDIFNMVEEEDVAFIRLQFCDIFGTPKNIAITPSQLAMALDHELTFDGSAVEGFVRTNESEMYLYPDMDTFEIYPWRPQSGKVARMFCDIYTMDRKPFDGDPRYVLKKVLEDAASKNMYFKIVPELEFFLFGCDDDGNPVPSTKEKAGYFDVAPADMGENVRRDIILNLEDMNFNILSSHHEIAPQQHEIDFAADEAGHIADMIQTFKMAVKTIARKHGYYATFMPKPSEGVNGSGMHIGILAFDDKGNNIFTDASDNRGLSEEAYYFIGGLLEHMKEISLVTNPLVNSYKRLVPGYDAPVNMSWTASSANHTSLIRIPFTREKKTTIELRNPDATCNPYLAIALCIAAGLDGINKKIMPPKEIQMLDAEKEDIRTLPQTLGEAIESYKSNEFVKSVLGQNVYNKYLDAKLREWKEFRSCVTQWEMKEYLGKY